MALAPGMAYCFRKRIVFGSTSYSRRRAPARRHCRRLWGASTRTPVVVMSETAAAVPRRSARPARLRERLVCASLSSAVAVAASAHLAKAATLGLVTALPQQLLHVEPVGFELGHLGGGVLRVPPVARQHPQLAEVVGSMLAKRPQQLVGLALAQRTYSADRPTRLAAFCGHLMVHHTVVTTDWRATCQRAAASPQRDRGQQHPRHHPNPRYSRLSTSKL